jgi:hypothetical protein
MWLAVEVHPYEIHIVPRDDLIEHVIFECECDPAFEYIIGDDVVMVSHNALDGREASEPDWK